MPQSRKIALAQLNPTVGDLRGNLEKARRARREAAAQGADIVVFPEMFLTGYPAEDLILKPMFLDAAMAAAEELAAETDDGGPAVVIGGPWRDRSDGEGSGSLRGQVYNAALVLDGGRVQTTRFKHHLPNYGVFDEVRIFKAGPRPARSTCGA